jgi:hypothetical protein
MKIKSLCLQAMMAVILTCGAVSCVVQGPVQTYDPPPGGPPPVAAFRNSTEARMLRDAYVILATGNHNYNGHREGAMQQVRDAADLLGLDLSGDGIGERPQVLSNERLREAKGLILQVLDSAQVKGQERVVRHLNEAVHQINMALGIR